MKQTAIQWFFLELYILKEVEYENIMELYEEANKMFEEQIMEAYTEGQNTPYEYSESNDVNWHDANRYYKETFKKENIIMFMSEGNSEIESIKLTDNPDCGIKGITFKSK